MIYIYVSLAAIVVALVIIYIQKMRERSMIRAIIIKKDRKMIIVKRVPHNNHIKVGETSYDINEKDFIMLKNMPTYIFTTENTAPINPYEGRITNYTPDQYNTALESKVVNDIIASSSRMTLDSQMISLIIAGVTVLALFVVAYLGNEKIVAIQEQIAEMLELLRGAGL